MFGFGSKQKQIDNLSVQLTYLEKKVDELRAQLRKVDDAAIERSEATTAHFLRGETQGTAKYTAIEGVNALLNHLDLKIYRKPAQDSKIELIKRREVGDPYMEGRGSD